MTLVAALREALAIGHERDPLLIGDDAFTEAPDRSGRTPAAVLVPIVDRPDPTVILTVRPQTMRRHAGQIAFPGGRIDPGDASPVAAALREAEEEIGLPSHHVEIIGTSDQYLTVTGFEVTPIVGLVTPDLKLTPSPDEVSAIFEAPLAYLLRPENQVERVVDYEGRKRRYFEIAWQDRIIWGATAAMLVNLGRRLALVA